VSRFPRSTREAFPCERFPAMFGPYKRDTFTRQLARALVWFVSFAAIGLILAWRM
jgi:hypothetical protein